MRHFAEELRSNGWNVTYEIAEDFEAPLAAWGKKNCITELRVITSNDRSFAHLIGNWGLSYQVTFVSNNHYLPEYHRKKLKSDFMSRVLESKFILLVSSTGIFLTVITTNLSLKDT